MFANFKSIKKLPDQRLINRGRSFLADTSGQTGIELALVGLPFLTMMFGIINTGMYFYAMNCLDRAVEDTARYLRTGEAQKGTVANLTTVGQFRNMVCSKATSYIKCTNLQISIQKSTDWGTIQPVTCITNGALTAGVQSTDLTPIATGMGTQNTKLLIAACYKWDMGKYLPFVHWDAKFPDGSALIQSSTALQIEPYN